MKKQRKRRATLIESEFASASAFRGKKDRMQWQASFAVRIAILAAVMLAMQSLVIAIERRRELAAVRPLAFSLAECPLRFGDWRGADEELDPQVYKALGADDQVTRRYVKATGEVVDVHLATWERPDGYTPHLPPVCLQSSGWEIRGEKRVRIEGSHNSLTKPKVIFCDRDGLRLTALYWYQLDLDDYTDRSDGKSVHRRVLFKRVKPPVVKVLVSTTPTNNNDMGTQLLQEVGQFIDQWLAEKIETTVPETPSP